MRTKKTPLYVGDPIGSGGVSVASGTAAAEHALVGDRHTAAGLTTGHFLKATGSAAFGFAAHGLTYSDVGAAAAGHNHSGVYEPVISGGTTAQYWRGDKSWQTLNQAAIPELTTGSSPVFVTVKLSGLTNGYIPYQTAAGLANSPISTDGTNAECSGNWSNSGYMQIKGETYLRQNIRFINKAGDDKNLFQMD